VTLNTVNLKQQYSFMWSGTVSQAYFALHETLHRVQNVLGNIFFGTKVTSEASLSIPEVTSG
jgi:predicted metalloprotease